MKKIKYIIAITVIIIIGLIVALLSILNNKGKSSLFDSMPYEPKIDKVLSEVKARNQYYTVKKIINNYFYDLTQLKKTAKNIVVRRPEEQFGTNDYNIIQSKLQEYVNKDTEALRNKIYNCLDKDFINKNNITINNLQEKLGTYNAFVLFIDNMYNVDIDADSITYFVSGKIIEKDSYKKTKFSIMIIIDQANRKFEIYPFGHEYDLKVGEELIVDKKEINNSQYNFVSAVSVDDETYCQDLFEDYKNRLFYDVDGLYEILDKEYREKKFGSLEAFKNYVQNNKTKLVNERLTGYSIEEVEDYTQYICEGKDGNYYYFKVIAPMQYTLIMDNYTIDTNKFTSIYDTTNIQGKVVLNLNKIMTALNTKDYEYVYNKLADSFKKANFPTQKSFEDYAKVTFFDKNEFEYVKFNNESDIYYTYEIKITDESKKDNKSINKTFIMQINEDKDFVISFNK